MFNVQCSMFNECMNFQCFNVLNHYLIDYSLTIVHCNLSIAREV